MREERLFQILGQIDGDLIVAADTPVKGTLPWGHYARLAGWAASLVLLVGSGAVVFQRIQHSSPPSTEHHGSEAPSDSNPQPTEVVVNTNTPSPEAAPSSQTTPLPEATSVPNQPTPTVIDGLPVLTMEFMVDGMGFEGYLAHSYAELKNANPWSEELGITHLPVFKNSIVYTDGYQVSNPDWEAMETELLDVAQRFGMTDITLDRKEVLYDPSIEGRSGDMTIDIGYDGIITIWDKETPALLPTEFDYQNYNMPYEKYYTIGEYLLEEYADFIDMENPCINVHGGDYNIYDDQSFDISFYDACEDPVQRIINYNFNQVHFSLLNGTLDLFRVEHPDLSNVVGNYPIISVAEAKELLIDHVYATTVPYDFPGEEYIHGCELVYRSHICEEYFLPYYCFYVELPEDRTANKNVFQNGMLTFGAYYVPAVEGKYIENMPVWELHFN